MKSNEIEIEIAGSKIQIGLDRLVLGIPFPIKPKSEESNPATQEQIAQFQTEKNEYVTHMKHIESVITKFCPYHCSKSKNKDSKRYRVLSEVDAGLICILTLGFTYGTGLINLEVNPSRLTPDRWAELHGLLSVMFNDHYEELYTKGVVSHAEFYVDIPGTKLSSLVLIDNSRRTTTLYKDTTYHGKRGARQVATMYDKAKEQKQKGKLIRIETRINRRDIRFHDLVETDLFNPFSNLVVADVILLHSIAQKMNAPKLATQIKELGLYSSVKNAPARHALFAQLKENAVPWWKPETIWTAHRKLLIRLRPEFAGVAA